MYTRFGLAVVFWSSSGSLDGSQEKVPIIVVDAIRKSSESKNAPPKMADDFVRVAKKFELSCTR